MVVARTKPRLHLGSGLTRAVLLLLEFPVNTPSGELICLVQPLDPLNKSVRKLADLPKKSASVMYSSPISMPKIAGTCPVAPELFTNEAVSKTGGLRTFHCVSRISSRHQAIKLYYLTPTLTIILCVPKTETLFFEGLPCILVSGIDRDCSVVKPVNTNESLSYVHNCSIYSLKNDNASSHSIHFSILRLRTHDFRGQVFCETLDLLTLGSPEESKIRAKLISDVMTLRFPLEPQILSFIFDASTQSWECRVAGYPLHGRARIQMVRVRPMWLGKQMEMYINTLNRTQPSVQHEHLVPPEAALKAKQLEYTIGVSHRPIVPLIGGLTNGIVELRCNFQGASEQLSTRIGISADPYESLVPESPTLKVGDVLNTVCTITAPTNGSVVHMSLHRMIYSEWATYDVVVISVTFETDEQSFLSQGLDNIQHKFDLLGLWTIGYHSAHVRVLTDQTGRSRSIDISVLSSVEFDSGSYYCSGRLSSGVFQTTEIQSMIVRGTWKQLAFGYKVLDFPATWMKAPMRVSVNKHILFRCTAWSTNPIDRTLRQLNLFPKQIFGRRNIGSDLNDRPRFVSIILKNVEYELVSNEYIVMNRLGCEMLDAGIRRERVIRGPVIQCIPPSLKWIPESWPSYPRTTLLKCIASHACHNMTFRWHLLAGPIPQWGPGLGSIRRQDMSDGDELYLWELPQSGTYVVFCTLTCVCANQTLSNGKMDVINIEPSKYELNRLKQAEVNNFDLDGSKELPPEESDLSVEVLSRRPWPRDEQPNEVVEERLDRYVADEEPAETMEVEQQRRQHQLPRLQCCSINLHPFSISVDENRFTEMKHFLSRLDSPTYDQINAVRRMVHNSHEIVMPQRTFMKLSPTQLNERTDEQNCSCKDQSQLLVEKQTQALHRVMSEYVKDRHKIGITSQATNLHVIKHPSETERLYSSYLDQYQDMLGVSEVGDKFGNIQHSRLGHATAKKYLSSRVNRQELKSTDLDMYTKWLNHRLQPPLLHGQTKHTVRVSNQTDAADIGGTKLHVNPLGRKPSFFGSGGLLYDETNLAMTTRERERRRFIDLHSDYLKVNALQDNRFAHLYPIYKKQGRSLEPSMASQTDSSNITHEPMDVTGRPWITPQLVRRYAWRPIMYANVKQGELDERYSTRSVYETEESRYADESSLHSNSALRRATLISSITEPILSHDLHAHPYQPHRTTSMTTLANHPRTRDLEPAERIDIVLTNREERMEERPWWSSFNVPTTGVSRVGPSEISHNRISFDQTKSLEASFRQVNSWADHRERLSQPIVESQSKWKDHLSQYLYEIQVKPGVVAIPGTTKLMCPVVRTSIKQTRYQFENLGWTRTPKLGGIPEIIILFWLQTRRVWLGSDRFTRPLRVYGYPPFRWSHTYTLDIKPLQLDDYGYYSCLANYWPTISNGQKISVYKSAVNPLCTVPLPHRPRLGLARYVGGSLREVVQTVWSFDKYLELPVEHLENHNYENGEFINTSQPVKPNCFSIGEEIIVFCETIPHQLFCEHADAITNGTRLIRTELQAYLYLMHPLFKPRTMSLPKSMRPIPPIKDVYQSSIEQGLTFRAWSLHISHEHSAARVVCQAQARLHRPVFGPVHYRDWLNQQLNPTYRQSLTRGSEAIELCVITGQRMIRILPEPIYQPNDPQQLGVVRVMPQETVSCTSTDTEATHLTFTIYPISMSRRRMAERHGLVSQSDWMDTNRHTTNWPRKNQTNQIRVHIPSEQNVLGSYFAQCTLSDENISTTFILEVYAPVPKKNWELDIKKIWIAVTIPVAVFLYITLRGCLAPARIQRQNDFQVVSNLKTIATPSGGDLPIRISKRLQK
ncbi:hypothetical protein PHET_06126 [Paragonimus heterotremus]|uniref:Ig-like domain-containing protein n=1 Tax=Paragonimus heterotremus TaxID=100268 RepID=A0A8J4SNS0_9TREM|nr:hypothetical protein PHET_06126 [Paragonimus heterotremus]